MPKMVATVDKLRYGKNVYMRGDSFDASDKDAKLLKGIRKAADAETMQASPLLNIPAPKPVKEVETPEPKKPRGRPRKYERRDMVATDGLTGEESE